jgi:membrane protein required for colicin V production
MTGFDIAVLMVVGSGAIAGFFRGFVQEVLALSAWLLSLVAIHILHTPLTEKLMPFTGAGPGAASVLAFCILLMVPYMLIKVVAGQLGRASRASLLGPIDRVIGFAFGGVKGAVITVMAFSILVLGYDTVWGVGGRPMWITQARSYPLVNEGSEALVKMIGERRRAAVRAADKV